MNNCREFWLNKQCVCVSVLCIAGHLAVNSLHIRYCRIRRQSRWCLPVEAQNSLFSESIWSVVFGLLHIQYLLPKETHKFVPVCREGAVEARRTAVFYCKKMGKQTVSLNEVGHKPHFKCFLNLTFSSEQFSDCFDVVPEHLMVFCMTCLWHFNSSCVCVTFVMLRTTRTVESMYFLCM